MEQSTFKAWTNLAEFLFFAARNQEQHVGARYADGTFWFTQNVMAKLFDVTALTIMDYLKNLYETGEIVREDTVRRFKVIQREGSRMIGRNMDFYSLDAVISVAYKLNTLPAIQFRKWATQILGNLALNGVYQNENQAMNYPFLGWNQYVSFLESLK